MKYHHLAAFLALLASYFGLHFYSASWLTRNFQLSGAPAAAVRIVFLLLAFFGPFTMFMRHRHSGPSLEPLYFAGYAWMGMILVIGCVFFFSDLTAYFLGKLAPVTALAAFRHWSAAALLAALAWSFYAGMKLPPVKETALKVPGLSPALEGLRIVQLSDMHLDSSYKLKRFASVIGEINAAKPDLVLVTGDLLDPGITCGPELRGLMRGLKPRLGVYGVLGNHEYYYGYDKSVACYRECGITLLRNESSDAPGFRILGVSDIMTEGITAKELSAILEKNRSAGFSVLMSHQPLMLDLISAKGDYIGFSGHTHRGQIFPFHVLTRMVYKYFYGTYRKGNSVFYVTSGAGTWGPSMRLFAPSEIPLVVLSGK